MTERTLVVAVIDSDPNFIDLLRDALGDEAMQVIGYLKSAHAFRTLTTIVPDLIILDTWIEHPHAGWHLLRLFRRHQATAHVPILLGSANQFLFDQSAKQLRDYQIEPFDKPCDLDELLKKVRIALQLAAHLHS